ncbi:MAG: DUF1080 domain-containing protein [Planctomycetales bacterium]|nr:DUF1080 domain-containing protein [Planctomycetales bacterium]
MSLACFLADSTAVTVVATLFRWSRCVREPTAVDAFYQNAKIRTSRSHVIPRFTATLLLFLLLPSIRAAAQEAAKPEAAEKSAAVTESDGGASGHITTEPQAADWIQLFNGRDLSGWIPKIRYHELGVNYGNTFRVEDGLLKVRYEPSQYPTFDERFGHLFFEKPFSHYRLRVEYRFVGEQCAGGPGWAIRNSGMMLHGEDPKLMSVDQDFPVSIECQLLGGNGRDPRTTVNLCTPGTNVMKDGRLFLPHCTSSSSKTYAGEQWVEVEVEVHGAGVVKHIIDGQIVLEYSQSQYDERDAHAKMLAERQGGLLISGGTISLQSESHPIDFRKVELLVLEE